VPGTTRKILFHKIVSREKEKGLESNGMPATPLINHRNSHERKDAYGRVIRPFLKTEFGKWLFRFRNSIEQTFNQLNNDRLEQPIWYGFHRYLLHVQLCIFMRGFEFLLCFATPSKLLYGLSMHIQDIN
jgi:hypothetical protein